MIRIFIRKQKISIFMCLWVKIGGPKKNYFIGWGSILIVLWNTQNGWCFQFLRYSKYLEWNVVSFIFFFYWNHFQSHSNTFWWFVNISKDSITHKKRKSLKTAKICLHFNVDPHLMVFKNKSKRFINPNNRNKNIKTHESKQLKWQKS